MFLRLFVCYLFMPRRIIARPNSFVPLLITHSHAVTPRSSLSKEKQSHDAAFILTHGEFLLFLASGHVFTAIDFSLKLSSHLWGWVLQEEKKTNKQLGDSAYKQVGRKPLTWHQTADVRRCCRAEILKNPYLTTKVYLPQISYGAVILPPRTLPAGEDSSVFTWQMGSSVSSLAPSVMIK